MDPLAAAAPERFEILERLGRGSMGAVYRAFDRERGCEVALKTLDASAPIDDRDLGRMRRRLFGEARSAEILAHPGIVPILEVFEDPLTGRVSLVAELVEATSLAEILRRPDPIPLELAVSVVAQAAEALDYVHSHGVVHHDVKPANILVTGELEVRLIDFELAEMRGSSEAAPALFGTPHYLPPERAVGGVTDHRGDVYSLGVVLYELLTRHLPFRGDTVADLTRRIVSEDPTPPETWVPDLLPSLQAVIYKALEKEPRLRYQRAGEIGEALRRILAAQERMGDTVPAAGDPLSAPPEPAGPAGPAEQAAGAPERPTPTAVPPPAPAGEPRPGWRSRLSGAGERAAARARRLLDRLGRRLAPLPSRLLAVRLGSSRSALLVYLGIALGLGLAVVGLVRSSGSAAQAPPALTEEQQRQIDYLALLREGQALLEAGETAAAARLFERAEELVPETGRIRRLRDEARRLAAEEARRNLERRVAELVASGGAALATGRVEEAATAVAVALELAPDDEDAAALAAGIERARARERARRRPAPPPPTAAAEPAPVRSAPAAIVEPIVPPEAAPAPDFGTLKLDFSSQRSRGVVTVYAGTRQVFSEAFRFVERQGFLRRRATGGGFDARERLPAGRHELRVYLALPDRPTQLVELEGVLPGGATRTLRVRVAEDGALATDFH